MVVVIIIIKKNRSPVISSIKKSPLKRSVLLTLGGLLLLSGIKDKPNNFYSIPKKTKNNTEIILKVKENSNFLEKPRIAKSSHLIKPLILEKYKLNKIYYVTLTQFLEKGNRILFVGNPESCVPCKYLHNAITNRLSFLRKNSLSDSLLSNVILGEISLSEYDAYYQLNIKYSNEPIQKSEKRLPVIPAILYYKNGHLIHKTIGFTDEKTDLEEISDNIRRQFK